MSYQVCGHCDQLLSVKTLKEHRRLFFDNGCWIRADRVDNNVYSDESSSLSLSPPKSNPYSMDLCEDKATEESSDEDNIAFPDFSTMEEECGAVNSVEYWAENDSDIDDDMSLPSLPADFASEDADETLNSDEQAIIWWIVAFTCLFETLHSLSSRAVAWLLKFMGILFVFFGRQSQNLSRIARGFPTTLHLRAQYLKKILAIPSTCNYVVCRSCHSLYKYEHCLRKEMNTLIPIPCTKCSKKSIPLLKEVVTSSGNQKFYPYLVFPNACLISSLQSLFHRPGFYKQCEHWRQGFLEQCLELSDVYCGRVWKNFMIVDEVPFLAVPNNIAFMLNIDWFQPFKHRTYSVGVVYLAIMNLPRSIRFKRENILVLGLIPGPTEPHLDMNTYLSPIVTDLLALWDGITISTKDCGDKFIRCALLCVGCDLPAGRKVCGFLSYTANLGCSRCYCNFGTGTLGQQNYSGFNRANWILRSNEQHREDVTAIQACKTKTQRQREESQRGCRYSSLLRLPYFDAVRMLTIDPMHNFYLGTAKHIFSKIWISRGLIDSTSLSIINERILSLNVPSEVSFSRLPASMEYVASLTAEQWMLWVNYYSLYCLYDILPSEDLENWRHFVLASRLLCKQTIHHDEIKAADALLLRFCQRFEALYGEESVTPNVHLHAHITDCIKDYGPMSCFWLFSFERFNGILGSEPTNNRFIEIQLMSRFMKDNSHFQLLSSVPDGSADVMDTFSHIVADYACSYTSTKHLDALCSSNLFKGTQKFVPASKYVIASFTDAEIELLYDMYRELYPLLFEENDVSLAKCYKKMECSTINGNKFKAGHYVLARNVFPFSSDATSVSLNSLFSTSNARPAKINFFLLHSIQDSSSNYNSHVFANVSWPEHHPFHDLIGKPYQLWCSSSFEYCDKNFIVPLDNIVSLLLTSEQIVEDQTVLITVPLIL